MNKPRAGSAEADNKYTLVKLTWIKAAPCFAHARLKDKATEYTRFFVAWHHYIFVCRHCFIEAMHCRAFASVVPCAASISL